MKNILNQLSHQANSIYSEQDLEQVIGSLSMRTVMWGALLLTLLLVLAALTRDRVPKLKKSIFFLCAFTVVLVTTIIVSGTIYLNVKSVSGGPVHWHADFEIWACDQELELRDPIEWYSNKIGTSTYHEHDDKRIHLEGVVVEERDASLGKFFYVTDGAITDSSMVVALNDPDTFEGEGDNPYFEYDTSGIPSQSTREFIENKYINSDDHGTYATFINGQTCADGSRANVQAFLYSIKKDENGNPVTINEDGIEKTVYTQTKLDDPASYIITDDSVVPPGDCLIFEFAPTKEFTDKRCQQYEIQTDELNKYYYEQPVSTESDQTEPAGDDTSDEPSQDGDAQDGDEPTTNSIEPASSGDGTSGSSGTSSPSSGGGSANEPDDQPTPPPDNTEPDNECTIFDILDPDCSQESGAQ